MANNHKIYNSLIKPPLPLGLTKEYIIFVFAVTSVFLSLILYVSPWITVIFFFVLVNLFFYGIKKTKEDWQYFSVLTNAIKEDGLFKIN
jgi:type IV secretory pathway VirB3-like protein